MNAQWQDDGDGGSVLRRAGYVHARISRFGAPRPCVFYALSLYIADGVQEFDDSSMFETLEQWKEFAEQQLRDVWEPLNDLFGAKP